MYDRLAEKNPEIEVVAADAGYKTPWISKRILDDGRIPALPYKRPMSKKDFFKPYEYVYDKYYDCVICPENQVLNYATTNRDSYREFKSKGYICKECPSRHLCTENAKSERRLQNISGLIILKQQKTSDTRLNIKSCMNGAKKQLNEYSLTQRKNTQCDIRHTGA